MNIKLEIDQEIIYLRATCLGVVEAQPCVASTVVKLHFALCSSCEIMVAINEWSAMGSSEDNEGKEKGK